MYDSVELLQLYNYWYIHNDNSKVNMVDFVLWIHQSNTLLSHSTKMYQVKESCRYWQITFSHIYTTASCVISLPKVIISTFALFTELHHERAVFMRFLPTLYSITSARGVQLSITKPCALCKCVQGLSITCYNWFPRQYRKQYCQYCPSVRTTETYLKFHWHSKCLYTKILISNPTPQKVLLFSRYKWVKYDAVSLIHGYQITTNRNLTPYLAYEVGYRILDNW